MVELHQIISKILASKPPTQGIIVSGFVGSRFLHDNPVVLLDLGCRDGFFFPFDQLKKDMICYGVDCNEEEIRKLQSQSPKYGRKEDYFTATIFNGLKSPIYHWKDEKDDPPGWGFYRINESFTSRFTDTEKWREDIAGSIPTIGLDDFCLHNGIRDVDFIKSDLEMADVEAMKSGSRIYSTALGVFVEIFFQPRHIGAPLFPEMNAQLVSMGFDFWDFMFWPAHRKTRVPFSPMENGIGQLFDGDALYLRDPIRTKLPLSISKHIKLAIIADLMGKTDFGLEILSRVQKFL